jgi:ADP-ribosyl-[dinitrogen reductase] hydrolase
LPLTTGQCMGLMEFVARHFFPSMRAMAADFDAELLDLFGRMDDYLTRGAPAVELADALRLQRGVTGYMYHTVPLALYCWLRHPGNLQAAIEEVIDLGGDTDSTAAIVGGIAGATVGAKGIPEVWINGIFEWPRTVAWMRALASPLADQLSEKVRPGANGPLPLFWPGLIPRNLLFLWIVLAHGFRRLLPPY